jgi:FMN reductase
MTLIVAISGSPSAPSRSAALAAHVSRDLRARGFELAAINVRDLPAHALVTANAQDPEISAAAALVARADAIVIATPIYKAAYTGVLKSFLDLLPQFAFAGKVVLPLATGGSIAHVLAIDYGLRPVLTSLGAQHVVNGLFVLDKMIAVSERGLALDADVEQRLVGVIDDFAASIARRAVAPEALRSAT